VTDAKVLRNKKKALKTDLPGDVEAPDSIIIHRARVHNLKNVSVQIPHGKLVVITGLSGSGKSSLAFNTLFAEGQRRYVESLSSYARQFLGKLDKPDVDYIRGLSPAIAIEQKVMSNNPRSTVGTVTEIYDYMKLLFARVGRTYSPVSGKEVKRHSVNDVLDFLRSSPHRFLLLFPWKHIGKKPDERAAGTLLQQGYSRVVLDKEIFRIDDLLNEPGLLKKAKKFYVVVDRIQYQNDPATESRILDSAESAFDEGDGTCFLMNADTLEVHLFSNRFEADGISFEMPSVGMFTFNTPLGACKTCEAFGKVIGIHPELVIPDTSRSVYDNAVVPWNGPQLSAWQRRFIAQSAKFGFPPHKPVRELSAEQYHLLWNGNDEVDGIQQFFKDVERNLYKIHYRILYSRYRGKTACPECHGSRLRKDSAYVKVAGKNIQELVVMPVNELYRWFLEVKLSVTDAKIADRIIKEISSRLDYLCKVGLGYLDLNRNSGTLSGGEAQRIQLATNLGSSLVGSTYILDEPSIGLHSRDTGRLIEVLKGLRDLGNSVIVVEHDEDVMRAADMIIDMGPEAGYLGGEVVFTGTFPELLQMKAGYTAGYLTGKYRIMVPESRRKPKYKITMQNASANNIRNLNVNIPLHCLVAVTGVSGSGKSTMIRELFYPLLSDTLNGYRKKMDYQPGITGQFSMIKAVEVIDQQPIGRSSRSNPASYIDAYTSIRMLMAEQQLSKLSGYMPGHFSFNVAGGRCETCEGEGIVRIEMQFMADVELVCDTCRGKRFKDPILEVQFRGKNVAEILNMTVDEAVSFFKPSEARNSESRLCEKVSEKMMLLQKVGLGYVKLGQSGSTLSGGEAQRVKLATFLSLDQRRPATLFIFDEPTTGLHFHDVNKLLGAFNELLKLGHSIIVIEHHPDIIKCADWIIDMGPEGGSGGGTVVFEGTPEQLVKEKNNYTAVALRGKL
jgi:excinuclease ABC subunit A